MVEEKLNHTYEREARSVGRRELVQMVSSRMKSSQALAKRTGASGEIMR